MHASDPKGIRAAAAAQLISSCGKYGLGDITKTHIFELLNTDELDLFAQLHIDEGSVESICRQMLKLLEVPKLCVLGPVSFAAFKQLFERSSASGSTRHTWIVIVRVDPRAVAAEEPTSPAPTLAPDCPATGAQPYEAQFNAFMEGVTAEGTGAEAAETDLPRVLQPHHFVVAWRRTADVQLAPTLSADSDFRTHGEPSPAVHHVPPHTPGLPQDATAYDVFRPS